MIMEERPSANHGERCGAVPCLVLLHYTAMPTADAALDWLSDEVSQVSAHYLISECGQIWRLVPEERRAWHAGRGAWGSIEDVNSHSIGIELANHARGEVRPPFPEPQMRALESLLPAIMDRWGIAPQGVLAHSDTAPLRKQDPGPAFDWRRLALQGLSIWPEGEGHCDLPEALHRIGYRGDFNACLAAFRLRFRPWARGEAEEEDRRIAAALADRHPFLDPAAALT